MTYNWREIRPLDPEQGTAEREITFAASNQVQADHDMGGPLSWHAKVGQRTAEVIAKYGRAEFDKAYIRLSIEAYRTDLKRQVPASFLKVRLDMLREMGVDLPKPQFEGDD